MSEKIFSFESIKALLLKRKQELLEIDATGEAAGNVVELDQTRVGRLSRMDALQAQAMSQETNQRRKQELRDIATALKHIDNGEYGYCIECGEQINPARLQSSPTATLCIECATRAEQS